MAAQRKQHLGKPAAVRGRAEAEAAPAASPRGRGTLSLGLSLNPAVLRCHHRFLFVTSRHRFPFPARFMTVPTVFPKPEPASQHPRFSVHTNTPPSTPARWRGGAAGCTFLLPARLSAQSQAKKASLTHPIKRERKKYGAGNSQGFIASKCTAARRSARQPRQLDAQSGDARDSRRSSLQTPYISWGFPFIQQTGTELAKANVVGKHIKASKFMALMWCLVASPSGSSPPW